MRQRMRPARLRVASGEHFVSGLQKNKNDIRNEFLDPLPIEIREDRGEIVRADIDDDSHARRLLMRCNLLQERLDQLDRQVVAAVEAEILESALNVALPRARESGDDDEIFGAIHSN